MLNNLSDPLNNTIYVTSVGTTQVAKYNDLIAINSAFTFFLFNYLLKINRSLFVLLTSEHICSTCLCSNQSERSTLSLRYKQTCVNAVEGNDSSLFRESCYTLRPRHFLWAESIL